MKIYIIGLQKPLREAEGTYVEVKLSVCFPILIRS